MRPANRCARRRAAWINHGAMAARREIRLDAIQRAQVGDVTRRRHDADDQRLLHAAPVLPAPPACRSRASFARPAAPADRGARPRRWRPRPARSARRASPRWPRDGRDTRHSRPSEQTCVSISSRRRFTWSVSTMLPAPASQALSRSLTCRSVYTVAASKRASIVVWSTARSRLAQSSKSRDRHALAQGQLAQPLLETPS